MYFHKSDDDEGYRSVKPIKTMTRHGYKAILVQAV